jgi:hypothetical protein
MNTNIEHPTSNVQRPMEQKPEVLFFGCYSNVRPGYYAAGHYLYSKHRRADARTDTPWGYKLDGGLLEGHGNKFQDDKYVVAKLDGWTAVSFWDNSGDSRGASNSAFVVHADITGEELLKLAREQWPEVFNRPSFPLKAELYCDDIGAH